LFRGSKSMLSVTTYPAASVIEGIGYKGVHVDCTMNGILMWHGQRCGFWLMTRTHKQSRRSFPKGLLADDAYGSEAPCTRRRLNTLKEPEVYLYMICNIFSVHAAPESAVVCNPRDKCGELGEEPAIIF
jgi:hypothetical protein